MDHNQFNNMVAKKKWSKSDPKDAVIVALITRANNLEDGKSRGSGGNPTKTTTTQSSGQGGSGYTSGFPGLEN